GHRVHLAAALEEVNALLLRDDDVAVEVGRALLELGEVLDRAQRALGPEQALLRNAAKRRRVYPPAHLLRPNVADEMRRRIRVAVRVTVEARHAEMRPLTAPVVGHVELLLRERRDEQSEPFELLRIQDTVEQLEKVLRRHELALRDVAELRTRRQVDRRRELGQEVLGNIELDVEAVQVALLLREDLVDMLLREHHAAFFVERMRQRLETLREQVALADLVAPHRSELFP